MSEEPYFAADVVDALEYERLTYLGQMFDHITARRLEAFNIAEGWRCLDVGAGGGSVARWLAAQVGQQGKVVATDINPQYLRNHTLPNLEVRLHNIVTDNLEHSYYDLVHCRAVLMHLAQPRQALQRMVAAVRPGGWLCIEEGDYGMFGAADPTHPSAEHFTRSMQAAFYTIHATGIMNLYFGRQLRELVEGQGFVDIGHDGTIWVSRGKEPCSRFHRLALTIMRPYMIAAGVLTKEDCNVLEHLYDETSFAFIGPAIFGAWGRRAS